ncbi:MAG: hypothetical protein LBF80_05275 [Spirochaetaceae bacterium]|jgi:hypothetical protein|nr:hypothetical protein [Spirochaetaceae bacterium]
MKRVCFVLTALVFAWSTAFTQAIFAPFVSRLSAAVIGRQVRLSWLDSDSVDGAVFIYRSTEPYTNNDAADISQDFVAMVPHGIQTYVDVVPSDGKWYYFAVASDFSQQRYTLLIPFSNTIDVTVGTGGAAQSSIPSPYTGTNANEYAPVFYNFYGSQFASEPNQPPYTQGAQVNSATVNPQVPTNNAVWPPYSIVEGLINPPARADITGIMAVAGSKGIEITFNAPDSRKNPVLYRSIQPLRSFADLLTATVVGLGVRSPYTDYVTPGVPYYYAVVYEDDLRAGKGDIFPGSNSTFIPAEVPVNQPAAAPTTAPVVGGYAPYSQAQPQAVTPVAPAWSNESTSQYGGGSLYGSGAYGMDGGGSRYGSGAYGMDGGAYTRTQQNSNEIRGYETPSYQNQTDETLVLSEPRVFNRDMRTSSEPEDHRLSLIVQGPFMWRDWQAARAQFSDFIVSASNKAAAERARFYLAQCWYFIGDIRTALSSFLKLQSVFPDEISIWIQASLNRIADR